MLGRAADLLSVAVDRMRAQPEDLVCDGCFGLHHRRLSHAF